VVVVSAAEDLAEAASAVVVSPAAVAWAAEVERVVGGKANGSFMKKRSLSKIIGSASLFLALCGLVYLIAQACAASTEYLTNDGFSGVIWLDSLPYPAVELHFNAHYSVQPSGSYQGSVAIFAEPIVINFYQMLSHDTVHGRDYFRKYYSSYQLQGQYHPGLWTLDSVYVDNGHGTPWEKEILDSSGLRIVADSLTSLALDFTR
jgi:hypothetical protein